MKALSSSYTKQAKARLGVWVTALMLALLTLAAYWPATSHDFVNYDDPAYVTENLQVQAGVTRHGLIWAFGQVHGEETYWHPLTWVSHMLDCQWYGLKPWGHHLTSILLHAVNVGLVFLVFLRMQKAVISSQWSVASSGEAAGQGPRTPPHAPRSSLHAPTTGLWPCVFLAALFALHPLQVDAVAWVAERKTLLSAFFWLLAMWAYVRYVESLKSKVQSPKSDTLHAPRSTLSLPSSIFYLLSLLLFALGLMCKPVLVTFPCVLLLLDYWPLRRLQLSTLNSQLSTVFEKLPFFALAAASSLITLLAHHALGILDRLPWHLRVENALVSYVRYLMKLLWPSRLAVFYPYPAPWPIWEVATCGLLLAVISGIVLAAARGRSWWCVGWFWFVGVMVPFSGLVQGGEQAMADRFMYIPMVGLLVAITCGLGGAERGGRYQPFAWSMAGGAAVVLCLVLMRQQLGYWKNSETLFTHALEVATNNHIAHVNLGYALRAKGKLAEASRHYEAALRLKPNFAVAHNNLGESYLLQGRIDGAMAQFQEAVRLKPDLFPSHLGLATALLLAGRLPEAAPQMEEFLRTCPPPRLEPQNNPLRERVVVSLNDLAWLLATAARPQDRDGARAVAFAERACELTSYQRTVMVGTLAAAYAEAGRFPEAVAAAEKAIKLANRAGDRVLLARNEQLLTLYRAGRPYHEEVTP